MMITAEMLTPAEREAWFASLRCVWLPIVKAQMEREDAQKKQEEELVRLLLPKAREIIARDRAAQAHVASAAVYIEEGI
jgi:hypothetical protein